MLKKKYIPLAMMLLFSFGICSQARAHNLWLNPDTHYPKVGTTVEIGIGWGHKYPAGRTDQKIKEGILDAVQAKDPAGTEVELTRIAEDRYQLNIDKPGAWLVTARINPGFFTTTPEGRKWGNKETVENPIKCTNFHIQAKTLLIAGGSDKGISSAAGQPLEVIPLANPAGLAAGDKWPVKLLFKGEPLADAGANATYAGFEPPKPPGGDKPPADKAKGQETAA